MQLFGKRRYVVLAFAVLVLFWGSAFSVVKVGLEHSPPMIFAGLTAAPVSMDPCVSLQE